MPSKPRSHPSNAVLGPRIYPSRYTNLVLDFVSLTIASEVPMLTPGEIAQIKAEIERLEKARKECFDGGIRKRIDFWIEEQKRKLEP